ncbi:MAG: MarC family protein [Oceanococcaceae bacterium]
MLAYAVDIFVTFVVIIDPIGLAPIFIGLTGAMPRRERRRIALRGVAIATIILLGFAFLGRPLLDGLGISLAALRIAGGLLLFLLAVDMLFARRTGLSSTTKPESEEAAHREDISVFPLAIPHIAGPGAITAILLLVSEADGDMLTLGVGLGVFLLVMLLTAVALLLSSQLTRVLGQIGANVISRVLGVLLAALAVQFVINGTMAVLAAQGTT